MSKVCILFGFPHFLPGIVFLSQDPIQGVILHLVCPLRLLLAVTGFQTFLVFDGFDRFEVYWLDVL